MLAKLPTADMVAAIFPQYTSEGDRTVIYTNDGQSLYYPYRLRTIIRHYTRYYALDLQALQHQTTYDTQRCLVPPLPLSPQLLLLPYKARLPLIKGDPTIGYLNFYAFAKLTSYTPTTGHSIPYKTSLHLTNGQTLHSLWSRTTIGKQLRHGQMLTRPVTGTVLHTTPDKSNTLFILTPFPYRR